MLRLVAIWHGYYYFKTSYSTNSAIVSIPLLTYDSRVNFTLICGNKLWMTMLSLNNKHLRASLGKVNSWDE